MNDKNNVVQEDHVAQKNKAVQEDNAIQEDKAIQEDSAVHFVQYFRNYGQYRQAFLHLLRRKLS